MTPSRTCFSLKGRIILWSIACWRIQRSLLMAMRVFFMPLGGPIPNLVPGGTGQGAGSAFLRIAKSYGSPYALTIRGLVPNITTAGRCQLHYRRIARERRANVIKQDLIQRVVERTGLPRTKAEDAVDAIFDSMKKTLIAGDRIELRGFGVFTVKPRKTGIGRNPRTGAEVTIAPGKAVRFKPGKELHLLD